MRYSPTRRVLVGGVVVALAALVAVGTLFLSSLHVSVSLSASPSRVVAAPRTPSSTSSRTVPAKTASPQVSPTIPQTPPPPSPPSPPSPPPTAKAPSPTATRAPASTSTDTPTATHAGTVVILGDDLSLGRGATSPATAFPADLGADLGSGTSVTVQAQRGEEAGYPSDALAPRTVCGEVDAAETVVVALGTNDYSSAESGIVVIAQMYDRVLYAATCATPAHLHRLACLGPWTPTGANAVQQTEAQYDAALGAVCQSYGGVYVSLSSVAATPGDAALDPSGHLWPNDAGHAQIAALLAAALSSDTTVPSH